MKNTLEVALVGIDIEEVKSFTVQNMEKLENESVYLPGNLGRDGVKIMMEKNMNPNIANYVVSSYKVEGKKYLIFFSEPRPIQ